MIRAKELVKYNLSFSDIQCERGLELKVALIMEIEVGMKGNKRNVRNSFWIRDCAYVDRIIKG